MHAAPPAARSETQWRKTIGQWRPHLGHDTRFCMQFTFGTAGIIPANCQYFFVFVVKANSPVTLQSIKYPVVLDIGFISAVKYGGRSLTNPDDIAVLHEEIPPVLVPDPWGNPALTIVRNAHDDRLTQPKWARVETRLLFVQVDDGVNGKILTLGWSVALYVDKSRRILRKCPWCM